jgi:hypothetical protein
MTAVTIDDTLGSTSSTWSITNSDAGNAILVAARGTASAPASVSYGGVDIPRLGNQNSSGDPDGVTLFGRVGGLPTGVNTVSVTGFSQWAGATTFTNPDSFGSVFTHTNVGTSDSISITGTTTGGMCAAGTSYGTSGGTIVATSPSVLQWVERIDSGSGSGNGWFLTHDSVGGGSSTALAWTGGDGDDIGMVGVEILPAADTGTDSSPAYATAASDLGGGSGSWTSVTNAEGSPDGSSATWTAP